MFKSRLWTFFIYFFSLFELLIYLYNYLYKLKMKMNLNLDELQFNVQISFVDFCLFMYFICFSYLRTVLKIGEGLYGEVFSYKKKDQVTLMKIIPVEGDLLVNNEPQKRFQEIITEVVILQ